MLIEQLTLIKEVGFGVAGLAALFYILKMVLTWSHKQAEKTLQLAEDISKRILDLSNTTIQKNSESLGLLQMSLEKMQETLVDHIHQKEGIVDTMRDCKNGRDRQLKEIKEAIIKKH